MTMTPVPRPTSDPSPPSPRSSRDGGSGRRSIKRRGGSSARSTALRGADRRRGNAVLLWLAAGVLSILPLALFYLSPANPDLPPDNDLVQALSRWGVRLTGIVCGVLMFWQLLVMARTDVVEKTFHRRRVEILHAVLGITVPVMLFVHILVRSIGLVKYPEIPGASPSESIEHFFVTGWSFVPAVAAAVIVFVIVFACIPRVRQRLRRFRWYRLHLFAYVAMVAALPHELFRGSTFGTGGVVTLTALAYWVVMTLFTLGVVGWYRLKVPADLNRDFPLVVTGSHAIGGTAEAAAVDEQAVDEETRIQDSEETGTTTADDEGTAKTKAIKKSDRLVWEVTLETQGKRGLEELGLRPGQYLNFMVRDQLPWSGWLAGTPWTPTLRDGRLVLAVDLHQNESPPQPGQQVLISGPHGRLTVDKVTSEKTPVLLAVSGTGVASARALAGELLAREHRVTVLHRVRRQELGKWKEEFAQFQGNDFFRYLPVIDGEREDGSWLPLGEGYGEGPVQWLAKNVDGIRDHEAYVVGSRRWVKQFNKTLRQLEVGRSKIHWE